MKTMNIELYTSQGCKWCKRSETLLKMAGIEEYKKHVVGVNITPTEVKEKFPNSVGYPVIVVDGEIVDIVSLTKLFLEKGLISSKK